MAIRKPYQLIKDSLFHSDYRDRDIQDPFDA